MVRFCSSVDQQSRLVCLVLCPLQGQIQLLHLFLRLVGALLPLGQQTAPGRSTAIYREADTGDKSSADCLFTRALFCPSMSCWRDSFCDFNFAILLLSDTDLRVHDHNTSEPRQDGWLRVLRNRLPQLLQLSLQERRCPLMRYAIWHRRSIRQQSTTGVIQTFLSPITSLNPTCKPMSLQALEGGCPCAAMNFRISCKPRRGHTSHCNDSRGNQRGTYCTF